VLSRHGPIILMFITFSFTAELIIVSCVTSLYDWSVSGWREFHITQVYTCASIYVLHIACRAYRSMLICTAFKIVTGCPIPESSIVFLIWEYFFETETQSNYTYCNIIKVYCGAHTSRQTCYVEAFGSKFLESILWMRFKYLTLHIDTEPVKVVV
jgi:hypothetical protein